MGVAGVSAAWVHMAEGHEKSVPASREMQGTVCEMQGTVCEMQGGELAVREQRCASQCANVEMCK